MQDRITIRLGQLREPLAKRLAKLKVLPSSYLRDLIAADLKLDSPVMKPGRVVVVSTKKVSYKVK